MVNKFLNTKKKIHYQHLIQFFKINQFIDFPSDYYKDMKKHQSRNEPIKIQSHICHIFFTT